MRRFRITREVYMKVSVRIVSGLALSLVVLGSCATARLFSNAELGGIKVRKSTGLVAGAPVTAYEYSFIPTLSTKGLGLSGMLVIDRGGSREYYLTVEGIRAKDTKSVTVNADGSSFPLAATVVAIEPTLTGEGRFVKNSDAFTRHYRLSAGEAARIGRSSAVRVESGKYADEIIPEDIAAIRSIVGG